MAELRDERILLGKNGIRRKYTIENWEKYLDDANDRLNKVKESKNADSIESQNKHEEYDEEYEEELKKFMRNYAETNMRILDESYNNYEYAKSTDFFDVFYSHLEDDKLQENLKPCKVMVLTANPIEKAILHYHIINKSMSNDSRIDDGGLKIKRIIHNNNVYYIFNWGKYSVAHIHQQQTGSYKDFGLFTTVTEALRYFKPNVILSIGVAFGIDFHTQNIGDVIVSKELFPYSENKRVDEIVKPDRSQDKMIDSWLNVRLLNSNGFLDDVAYGGVLSGGSVMSSFIEKDRICTAYSKNDFVVGGEMEGSALFQVAPSCNIPCAVIKGICDWGVAKNNIFKNDLLREEKLKISLQAFAMQNVVSKCDILFNDRSLFCSPKMKAEEIEKARKKRLLLICILSNSLILTFGLVSIYLRYSATNLFDNQYIRMMIIIVCISFISMISSAIAVNSNKFRE